MNPTPTGPEIIVHNEPPQSKHEVDQKFNAMRIEFIPYIKEFIAQHPLFKNEEKIGITFAQKGASSIIAILDRPEKKLILKISRSKTFSAGEGYFLKVWEDAGVKVPHVFEYGILHDFPYTIMEYINAPTLNDVYRKGEMVRKGIHAEMGKALRLMHSPKTDGYGFVVNEKPEFKTVDEWLASEDIKKRLDYMEANNLLDAFRDYLPKVFDIIKQEAPKESPCYCHDDFSTHNIFATEPITIFDANPKFNSRYYDLGRIVFGDIASRDTLEASDQLLEGYFGQEEYNKELLHAYTFLAYCMKLPYWHKTERKAELEKAANYFSQNRI